MALTRVGSKGIAPGAVDPNDIAANAITETKIANSAVTPDKISGQVPVSKGGTGAASLTTNAILLGNGTSAVATVTAGTSGNVLTSDGTAWISKGISAGGNLVSSIFRSPGTWDANVKIAAGLKAIRVTVVGAGGGAAETATGTPLSATGSTGGTTSFGTLASATGGVGGAAVCPAGCTPNRNTTMGLGGVGTSNVSSNVTFAGGVGGMLTFNTAGGSQGGTYGGASILSGNGQFPTRPAPSAGAGAGASSTGTVAAGGAGGGTIIYLNAPQIPGPVTVTIGTGGARAYSPAPGVPANLEPNGANGIVVVEEFY